MPSAINPMLVGAVDLHHPQVEISERLRHPLGQLLWRERDGVAAFPRRTETPG